MHLSQSLKATLGVLPSQSCPLALWEAPFRCFPLFQGGCPARPQAAVDSGGESAAALWGGGIWDQLLGTGGRGCGHQDGPPVQGEVRAPGAVSTVDGCFTRSVGPSLWSVEMEDWFLISASLPFVLGWVNQLLGSIPGVQRRERCWKDYLLSFIRS